MNVFKNMFEMTKRRIVQTPTTAIFLILGLALSMLLPGGFLFTENHGNFSERALCEPV